MAPSLMLAEFPPSYPTFDKETGTYSPKRSQSLASNTTGSAQDCHEITDGSENESWSQWGISAGDGDLGIAPQAAQQYEAFCPPPLLAAARRRSLPLRCNLDSESLFADHSSSPVRPKGNSGSFSGDHPSSPLRRKCDLDSECYVADHSSSPVRRKGTRRSTGSVFNFAASQESPQCLPPHITAALDAAVAALDAAEVIEAPPGLSAPPGLDMPIRPPPGLEAPPGLEDYVAMQDPSRVPPVRYQTPPPSQRLPASTMASPQRSHLMQQRSPFSTPAEPWSPAFETTAHMTSPWRSTANYPVAGPPHYAQSGHSPTFLSTSPALPVSSQPPACIPPQPPMWHAGASPVSPQATTPVPPQPATWGPISPVPPHPATWGSGPASPVPVLPATWDGVPPCPPPAWPAPRCMEATCSDSQWTDMDMPQGLLPHREVANLRNVGVPEWL